MQKVKVCFKFLETGQQSNKLVRLVATNLSGSQAAFNKQFHSSTVVLLRDALMKSNLCTSHYFCNTGVYNKNGVCLFHSHLSISLLLVTERRTDRNQINITQSMQVQMCSYNSSIPIRRPPKNCDLILLLQVVSHRFFGGADNLYNNL